MDTTERFLEGARVLCVDDDPDSLELLRMILARRGALVTSCASTEHAIETLRHERFDALVSDLSMPPGLGGYDLAHALRKMEDQDPERPATPAVVVSGDALQPSRKRHFADFQVYMPKPFDKVRLVHVLDRLIEADGEAVKLGSLGIWEAKQATAAAAVATEVAANATSGAAEATAAAADATTAAKRGRIAAAQAEASAAAASAAAPGNAKAENNRGKS